MESLQVLIASYSCIFKCFKTGYLTKISNEIVSKYSCKLLHHLIKMTSVCHHVVSGITPGTNINSAKVGFLLVLTLEI